MVEDHKVRIYSGQETQGTETSKYLEEKITIVIPQVVASERGPALKYLYRKQNVLESTTKEGESPVWWYDIDIISSKAKPVKLCPNIAAPSAKAKYSWETDSEPVLWRKGEKNP